MNETKKDTVSLFDELYTGLNQAIDFVKETGEAKISACRLLNILENENIISLPFIKVK